MEQPDRIPQPVLSAVQFQFDPVLTAVSDILTAHAPADPVHFFMVKCRHGMIHGRKLRSPGKFPLLPEERPPQRLLFNSGLPPVGGRGLVNQNKIILQTSYQGQYIK